MGISETSLKNSEAKYVYKNIMNDYISYFTNTKNKNHFESGTGIIVSRFLDTHIFNTMEYKRQGNLKIRIIQCYLPVASYATSVQDDYINKLKRLINNVKRKHYKIIMMGDLNNHYDSFLKRKQQGLQMKSKYRLFEYLKKY